MPKRKLLTPEQEKEIEAYIKKTSIMYGIPVKYLMPDKKKMDEAMEKEPIFSQLKGNKK